MKPRDLIELEEFEKEFSILSKYKSCNARLLFFALRNDLKGVSGQDEFKNYVVAIGIIELTFWSSSGDNKIYQLEFTNIKGFDVNVKLGLENFKRYAKEYLKEVSQKISLPIVLTDETRFN